MIPWPYRARWLLCAAPPSRIRVGLCIIWLHVCLVHVVGLRAEPPVNLPSVAPTQAPPALQALQLTQLNGPPLHSRLEALLGRPIPVARADQQAMVFRLGVNEQSQIQVEVNAAGKVILTGPAPLVQSWSKVVAGLDRARTRDGLTTTQVVPVRNSQPAKIRQVVAALQGGSDAAQPAAPLTGAPAGPAERGDVDRLLGLLFQQPRPADQTPDDAQPAKGQATDKAGAEKQPAGQPDANQPNVPEEPATGALVGQVQIEFLEGLDVIVIRGHQKDVERVVELINQIEQLSATTQPTIELVVLQHVGGVPLSEMVQRLYDETFLARHGRISMVPLVKPNALLLVGRAEGVAAALDLIRRLDQPADAAAQFRVFQLKHAAAGDVKTAIDEFFAGRAGLGTRVLVTADFRSNALVVQASPRDLEEVALLIARLDTPTSAAVNELRVFKLKNSLAEDLAPVLQQAILMQAAGAQPPGQVVPQVPLPTQTGTTAGQQARLQQARSAMLRFLTIDAQGHKRLQSGILSDVRITADPRGNALVVSAPAASMGLIEALIRELDEMPVAEAQLKVFTIANGDAPSLAQMLESLFGRATAQRGAGAELGASGLGGQDALVRLRFSVDQRTNSIIASGTAADLAVVEAILLRLDASDVRQRQSVVYRLKNAPAADVANAVNELLRSERQVQQTAPGVVSPFEQIEREVVVVPEPVSNSLIVSSTPRYFEEIRKLVEQIDKRPPMVMIQVVIAEVALNNADEFGVELGIQDSLLFDRSMLGDLVTTQTVTTTTTPGGAVQTVQQDTIQAASLMPGFNFNNQPLGDSGSDKSLATAEHLIGQALSTFGVGRTNSELGYGGLVLSAASQNINILIRALQERRRLDVLSRPQIMTLDNQPAFIQVGQRVPRITGTQINQTGQVNTIQLENVGIILGVTPRISPDGLVVMEIDAEKSELGPESEGIPVSISATGEVIRSPRINTTTAQTTVSAVSGQTVVLGGLITKNKSAVQRRIPGLSDVPLLGNFFRYDSQITRRTELLIIMTPKIIRNEQDAEIIKQEESARVHWVLSDVVDMHGPAGLRSRDDAWGDHETMVIYPDMPGYGEPEQVPPTQMPADGTLPPPRPVPGPTPLPTQRPPQQYQQLQPQGGPPTRLQPPPQGVPPQGQQETPQPAGGPAVDRPVPNAGTTKPVPGAPASVLARPPSLADGTWAPPPAPPQGGQGAMQQAGYETPTMQQPRGAYPPRY